MFAYNNIHCLIDLMGGDFKDLHVGVYGPIHAFACFVPLRCTVQKRSSSMPPRRTLFAVQSTMPT